MQDKKFIESYDVSDWEVLTDTGWEDIVKIHKTIPYKIWELKTKSCELKCADNHIVFNDKNEEIFVKDLKIGDKIITENGLEEIIYITETSEEDNMYDLELNKDSNHRYYSNGILSHNTATSLTYVLWYAMKYPYKEILITSFGEESANKNLADVKMLYENCPDFLKRGIIAMNESTIKFDNKSKIFSRPTTLKAPRGLSPALIYCDEFAFVGTAGASKGAQMQEEFYAAISPALSASRGKLAITSTPISETDKFYNLWSNAIKKTNDDGTDIPKQYILEINGEKYQDFHLFETKEEAEKYLNSLENKENIKIIEREPPGNNGFVSQLVKWDACPLKDENWAKSEIKKVGEERFQREYNCLSGKNMIKILDKNGQVFDISIENFYNFY